METSNTRKRCSPRSIHRKRHNRNGLRQERIRIRRSRTRKGLYQKKAKYRVIIDCGRFIDRLFFCEEHKPQSMIMGEMDDKQHDTNINTILTTLALPTFPTEKTINKD